MRGLIKNVPWMWKWHVRPDCGDGYWAEQVVSPPSICLALLSCILHCPHCLIFLGPQVDCVFLVRSLFHCTRVVDVNPYATCRGRQGLPYNHSGMQSWGNWLPLRDQIGNLTVLSMCSFLMLSMWVCSYQYGLLGGVMIWLLSNLGF